MNQSQFSSTEQSEQAFLSHGFDTQQALKTNGGEIVDIITTNGPGPAPVIGLIFPGRFYGHQIRNGAGKLHRWNYEGQSYDASVTIPRQLNLASNVRRNFVDWHRPYATRGQGLVRIIDTNRVGSRKYVGLVFDAKRGSEKVVLYYPNGKTHNDGRETEWDLINIG